MENITNCVYCHNNCTLDSPKCGKGEKMAAEVAAGTWNPEAAAEGGREHGEHGKDGHHGEHGHRHHGHGHHGEHTEHGSRGEHKDRGENPEVEDV